MLGRRTLHTVENHVCEDKPPIFTANHIPKPQGARTHMNEHILETDDNPRHPLAPGFSLRFFFLLLQGFTPLHVAARCGRLPVLKALLDAGESVDSLSFPAETTPLHLSAGFSRASCVQELLERGADPSRRNKRGATPLDMVGTLIIPVSSSSNGGGGGDGGGSDDKATTAREAYEKKLVQGARVKVALARAQRWQRRRGAVLVWEALRKDAAAAAANAESDSPEGSGDGAARERSEKSGGRKRCRRPLRDGGSEAAAGTQGWLVAQLCAYPDAALMKSVILFL